MSLVTACAVDVTAAVGAWCHPAWHSNEWLRPKALPCCQIFEFLGSMAQSWTDVLVLVSSKCIYKVSCDRVGAIPVLYNYLWFNWCGLSQDLSLHWGWWGFTSMVHSVLGSCCCTSAAFHLKMPESLPTRDLSHSIGLDPTQLNWSSVAVTVPGFTDGIMGWEASLYVALCQDPCAGFSVWNWKLDSKMSRKLSASFPPLQYHSESLIWKTFLVISSGRIDCLQYFWCASISSAFCAHSWVVCWKALLSISSC